MGRANLLGVIAACAACLLGGTAVVATRYVVQYPDPLTLVLLRYGLGVAALLPIAALLRSRPRRADWVPLVALALLFYVAFPYLFNVSLRYTTAARGALALATMPLMTALIGAALGAERLTPARATGVLLALGGVAVALGGELRVEDAPLAWLGDLAMLGTALCGGVYMVLSRPLVQRIHPLVFTACGMLVSVAVLAPPVAWQGGLGGLPGLPPAAWWALLYLGLPGTAGAFFLWMVGLRLTSATSVSVAVALNPLSAMTAGLWFLGEPVGPRLVGGMALVVAGIAVASRQPRAAAQERASAERPQPARAGPLPFRSQARYNGRSQ